MIAEMSLKQLREVVGGELRGSASFKTVSTDTRSLRTGDLFVALQGPNFDGNKFVEQAKERGACAALVSAAVASDLPMLIVPDTRIALGRIGAWNRKQAKAKVIALTGSQGKTTVKEMTAAILAQRGSVLYTQGNLNNDIGVPLTLLQISAEHDFAVIELGANHKGEIAYTTALTQPDIALINNVAATHVEGFGSLQGVAEGKSELWQGLGSKGIAVVNLDDSNVATRVPAGVHRVGISAAGDATARYRVSDVQDKGLTGSRFNLHTPAGSHVVEIHVPGRHNVGNALAAAALALEAGADLQHVVQGLGIAHAAKGRMNILKGKCGAVIIDDSYNASPSSFHAAIDVLAALPGVRIVVAGDMAELGDGKEQAHRALGDYAARKGIDLFFGTGVLTAQAVTAFGSKGVHITDRGELASRLLELLAPGTSVLVKGSRSAGMERVVKQLTELED